MQHLLLLYLKMIILLYLIGLESHVTGRFHRNEKADMSIRCRQKWLNPKYLVIMILFISQNQPLRLISRAMIVKRCKITGDMLSNSLKVAKHTHLQQQFILRPLKIVHHSCEYTKRCKTFVLMFVRCTAIIWIALGRVWIVCLSTIQRRLDATSKTYATNARARATYARARAKLKNFDRKVV